MSLPRTRAGRLAGLALVGLLALAGWAAGSLGLGVGSPRAAAVPHYGPLPAISARTDAGQPFAGWQSLSEPALLVTLWASWCNVCMAELPGKLAYVRQTPGVALVAISIDTDAAAMLKARQKLGAGPEAQTPRVYWLHDADKQGAFTPLQASGVPETFVADARRHILAKQNGPTDLQYGPLAGALETALR